DRAHDLDGGANRANLRAIRACIQVHQGDHAGAAATADAAAKLEVVGPDALYNLACAYSLASAAAGKDGKLPEGDRTRLAEERAVLAVESLRKCHAAGYLADPRNLENMKHDTDLGPLRSRADFKKLAAEIEKGPAKKGRP